MSQALQFLDVTITVTPAGSNRPSQYEVRWTGPDSLRAHGRFPVSIDIGGLSVVVEQVFRKPNPTTQRSELIRGLQDLGSRLFQLLIQSNFAGEYDEAMSRSRIEQRYMRLHLDLTPELQFLPVELLWDPGRRLALGANDAGTLLVREGPGPVLPPSSSQYPLRLLIVAADSHDAEPLQVRREVELLREKMRPLEELGLWQVDVISGRDTLRALRELHDAGTVHAMHFIGHATIEPQRRVPLLGLTDSEGRTELVDPDRLVSVLGRYRQLQLVVLNACHGGRSADQSDYSSLAHALLRLDIPAVVAMARQIADTSAVAFSAEFYHRLCQRMSIDEAVSFARTTLLLSSDPILVRDWSNPQLFQRSRSVHFFANGQAAIPWETAISQHRTAGRFADAMDLVKKVVALPRLSPMEQQRLIQQATLLADDLKGAGHWEILLELSGSVAPVPGTQASRSSWESLAANRIRFRDVCKALDEAIVSHDAIESNRALARCQRLVDRLVELARGNPPSQHHWEIYDDNPSLWSQQWYDDLRVLGEIQRKHRGTVLPGEVVDLMSAVDRLIAEGAYPAEVPFEMPVEVAAEFLLAPADPVALESARHRAVKALSSGFGSTVAPVEQLLRALGADAGLVCLASGQPDRAAELWERELQKATDRDDVLRLCRQLAIGGFQTSDANSSATTPLDALGDRALACWAILLGNEANASESEAPGTSPLSPARRDRLERWLTGRDTAQAAEPPVARPSAVTGIVPDRDLELVGSSPVDSSPVMPSPFDSSPFDSLPAENVAGDSASSTPPPRRPATPRERWLAAELAGARWLGRICADAVPDLLPVAFGCEGLHRLGWHDRFLEVLSDRFDPNAEPPTFEKLIEMADDVSLLTAATCRPGHGALLRLLFSPFRMACLAALAGEPNEDLLVRLGEASLVVPGSHAASDDPLLFLRAAPPEWSPRIGPGTADEFRRQCPAYAGCSPSLLASDVAWLCGRALADALWGDCFASNPPRPRIERTVSALRLLPTADLVEECGLLQSHIVRQFREERSQGGRASGSRLWLLEAAGRLADSDDVKTELAESWLSIARQLLDDEDLDGSFRAVCRAVDCAPEHLEARKLKVAVLLMREDRCELCNQVAEARALCLETMRTIDEGELDEELMESRLNAVRRLQALDAGSRRVPEIPRPVLGESEWRPPLERARNSIDQGEYTAAIGHLELACDCADDNDIETHMAPLFVSLLFRGLDETQIGLLLETIQRCCPSSPRIQGELRRLQQFVGQISAGPGASSNVG